MFVSLEDILQEGKTITIFEISLEGIVIKIILILPV